MGARWARGLGNTGDEIQTMTHDNNPLESRGVSAASRNVTMHMSND
jgi:hypothetical protein